MCKMPCFRERLNQLLTDSGKTIVAFAEFLGTSRQSLGYYLNGERVPDALMVKQICERCNVSADWLLGLSETKTTDTNLKAVCKFTGLSPETIKGFNKLDIKMLNLIYKDKKKAGHLYAMFCDFDAVRIYSSIKTPDKYKKQIMEEAREFGIDSDQKNTDISVALSMSEFNILHAGRCAERLAELIAVDMED